MSDTSPPESSSPGGRQSTSSSSLEAYGRLRSALASFVSGPLSAELPSGPADAVSDDFMVVAPDTRPDDRTPMGFADTVGMHEATAEMGRPLPVVDDGRRRVGDLVAGRYRLLDRLGAGGFGDVFRAGDILTGRAVALKVIGRVGRGRADMIRAEVSAMRLARLPGVVRFLDDGPDGATYFIVMELVAGQPFPGGAPLDVVVPRLLQVLARLHRRQIVHRDLKPGNVLVDAHGRPTIIDLGIAKGRALVPTDEPDYTGTEAYAAPEHRFMGVTDVRSDLYSVGRMIRRAADDTGVDLSPDMQRLCDHLLAFHAPDRPQSAEEALDLIRTRATWVPAALGDAPIVSVDVLEILFAGPEPFLHLPSDAARVLWRRTGGHRAAVIGALTAWLDAGLAYRVADTVVISRRAIDYLEAGMPLVHRASVPPVSPAAADLLCWIRLAGPNANRDVLAATTGFEGERLVRMLDELLASGAIWWCPEGYFGAAVVEDPAPDWAPADRAQAHRLLAGLAEPHSVDRLRHLAGAGTPFEDLVDLVRIAARHAFIAGHLVDCRAALAFGIELARAIGQPDAEGALLDLVVCEALAHERERPRQLALYAVGRATLRSERLAALESLLRAAILARRGESARALAVLDALEPMDDPLLDVWRVAVRMDAARGRPDEESVLDALSTWSAGHPSREAMRCGWRGLFEHRSGRYAEATRLHARAAAARRTATSRLAALGNQSLALLEALDFDRAAQVARTAALLARRLRLAQYECQMVWVGRTADYRRGLGGPARPDLVYAAERVDPESEAIFAATEAGFAWRCGDLTCAVTLADRARSRFMARGAAEAADLMHALAICAGGETKAKIVSDLAAAAHRSKVLEIGVQILGLLRLCGAIDGPRDAMLAMARRARPENEWKIRLDVVSFQEAIFTEGTSPHDLDLE